MKSIIWAIGAMSVASMSLKGKKTHVLAESDGNREGYYGCYSDYNTGFENNLVLNGNTGMTIEKCADNCVGYKYYGLRMGAECKCTKNEPTILGSNCNLNCVGDSNEICGGSFVISYYTYPPKPQPLPASDIKWSASTNYWRFDRNSGKSTEDGVNSKDGVVNNALWVGGHAQNQIPAIEIDGSDNSYVDFGSAGKFGTSDFTVTLWFKTTDTTRYFDVIGNRAEGSHGNFFCIRMTGTGVIGTEIDEDGNNYIALTNPHSGLNDGKWHHVAVTRKGTTLQLYVDGQKTAEGSSNGVANIVTKTSFRLGRSLVGYESKFAPKAQYSQLRILHQAISATEILGLYSYT